MRPIRSFELVLAIIVVSAAGPAHAATIGFKCLTNNSSTCSTSAAPYFTANVNNLGGGVVQFLFKNSLPAGHPGRITTVYLDEGSVDYFSSFTISPTAGTSFSTITSGTLPGGNPAPFNFRTDHGANRRGGAANGVDRTETLDLRGTLNSGRTYAQLLANIGTPTETADFRMGLHVISLDGGFSEGLISVPEPATNAMIGLAFAAMGAASYLRRRRA